MWEKFKTFLKRKDIEVSVKRYGIDALGAMAQGLFCSLLIGTILNTLGTQLHIGFLTNTVATVSGVNYTVGGLASAMSGPATVSYTHLDVYKRQAPVLIYPVVGILVIGLGMTFIVEPVMGGINTGLNSFLAGMGSTSRVLLGFILAAMMAIDMGGPFNKAAYVFGTASIAAGNYDIMAAVMIGGMVPPCAIALATILFKNKFTKEERDAGPTNFIMGLAFITEGAIPYAAADPLHVIPACIIGSGAAGAVSMFFKCTLMAPHGGIFVFPVVGNAIYYVIALVAGTIISTICLGLFKKKAA